MYVFRHPLVTKVRTLIFFSIRRFSIKRTLVVSELECSVGLLELTTLKVRETPICLL